MQSALTTTSPAGTPECAPHIVTVTHFFPAHGGGLEKVAAEIVNGLAARGFSVCWFSSATDPAPAAAHGAVVTVSIATTNLVERLTQLPYPLWSLRAIPRLWRAIGRAQVVHVHEHLYFPSIMAILVARLRRRPVVITQHIGALGLRSRASTMLYEVGARLLGLLLFPLAARSVFISRNVLTFFRRDSSATSRLIFNGVDTQRFAPTPAGRMSAIREQLHLPADRRIVLFVGRFVRKKGINRIIELAGRFPDVLWLLVGSGPEMPSRRPANVMVAGRVEHDRLHLFYQAADLLILPSSGEGLPLVVQEALCCGTGVLSTVEVATACPEAAHLMRTQPVPRQHDGISGWESELRAALDDPAYLGEDARLERARFARSLWSWEGCVSAYEALFRELAEGS